MSNVYVLRAWHQVRNPKPLGPLASCRQARAVRHQIDAYHVVSNEKEGSAIPSRGAGPHATIADLHDLAPDGLGLAQKGA